jgi:hypothetical protein
MKRLAGGATYLYVRIVDMKDAIVFALRLVDTAEIYI